MNAYTLTVSFISGSESPPGLVPDRDNSLIFNPAIAFASERSTYDGTGFVNSGVLNQKGARFTLTFTKAGAYSYVCLLHPGMVGALVVQPAGSTYPMTQAQIDAMANQELSDRLAQAQRFRDSAQLTSQPNDDGTTTYTVAGGIGGNRASVLRFLPPDVTVKAGDSITWQIGGPHEVHTVTFYDPSEQVPWPVQLRRQQDGPPKFAIFHVTP